MAKPCSVCVSSNRDEIERAVMNRISIRETARTFGVSASAVARHNDHAGIAPDSRIASHLATAEELIAAVKVIRGTDFAAQDLAEAQHLRSLAEAVDASPANIGALRELRLTLDQYRRLAFHTDPSEQQELAELIAKISGGADPDRYDRVFRAAMAAGADEDAARAAGDAALGRENAGETWHETMARLHPEQASKYLAEGAECGRNGR
jgi:hypothetical protein